MFIRGGGVDKGGHNTSPSQIKVRPPPPKPTKKPKEESSTAPIKCIVRGCSNRSDQGSFVGDLCNPCYRMLSSGNVVPSNAWFVKDINNLRRVVSDVQRVTSKYNEET